MGPVGPAAVCRRGVAQKFITDNGAEITSEAGLDYARGVFDSRFLTVTTVSGATFPVEAMRPSLDQPTAGFGVVVQAGTNLSAYAKYDAIPHTGNTAGQIVQPDCTSSSEPFAPK